MVCLSVFLKFKVPKHSLIKNARLRYFKGALTIYLQALTSKDQRKSVHFSANIATATLQGTLKPFEQIERCFF